MEPNNDHTQASSKPEYPSLPKECNFTMQQWLYRRTLHTKRYKKRYVVLHNERLYTFTKLPSFDKFDGQNLQNLLKLASNSWILTGSIVSADPDVNSGLYRWKIQFKSYKKPVSATDNFAKFLMDKPDLSVESTDHVDSIFEDLTASVLENRTAVAESHDCLWFATTNHKIASDWVIALLHTSRYGSLYNLVYKNPARRRYQQFTLPWYLIPLDYVPNLSHDENSKQPLTSFTYIKIHIHRLFDFPMLPNAKIYVAVEFNSSFYILQLYRYESENLSSTPRVLTEENLGTSTQYVHRNPDYTIGPLPSEEYHPPQFGKYPTVHDPEDWRVSYTKMGSVRSLNDVSEVLPMSSILSSNASVANSVAPGGEDDPQNVLTRLLNLNTNKNIEKKQIVERRSIIYNDAALYIPVYKNTTQEVVWLHFFGDFDVYMGTASIRDVDFGSRDPAPIKTCMIKLIEGLNPLNYKRVDISTYKGESTVLNKSTAKSIPNDRGFVELSVIIPKHLGNFLDPVTISYGSPKEYLANATKSSITVGIQMLIANIKRVRQSFTVFKDIILALKSVLEFRSMISSFTAMSYFILVFGIFPNRMLIIFLLPLLVYILYTHPSFIDLTFLFLLRFPILIAILPKRLIHPFLLMPKTSCILCSKKPSFLAKNTQTVDPDMITKAEISSRTFQYSSNRRLTTKSPFASRYKTAGEGQIPSEEITNPFSAANAIQINTISDTKERHQGGHSDEHKPKTDGFVDFEKRISVHLNSLPMITSKHLLNDSIEIKHYRGTRIETCKHRGIIMSYLSIMFINEMGVDLFESVQGDGLSIIKGYHDIYYNTPPYRHVPLWPNVKFTLYFFLYMLFLTFFGGISNLQLLHLLHRNKLTCRLTLETTGVVGSKTKTKTVSSKLKTATLYENERRILFGKFSKLNLRFYERGYFSTEDGQFVSVDLSKYLVRLVVNENTDPEGWTYSKNWNTPFSKESTSLTFVRRRKWLLTPKESKPSEYILKRRYSSNLTSDYFTNINAGSAIPPKPSDDHELLSVSSLESFPSSKISNINLRHLPSKTLDRGSDKPNSTHGSEENSRPGTDSNVTNITDISKKPSAGSELFTTDENITRLYSRKGRLRNFMERMRENRERKRSQRMDNSNMHQYLTSLVLGNKQAASQPTPRKMGLFRSRRKQLEADNLTASSANKSHNGLNHLTGDDLDMTPSHPARHRRSDSSNARVSLAPQEHQNALVASLSNVNAVPTIQEDDTHPPSTLGSRSSPNLSYLPRESSPIYSNVLTMMPFSNHEASGPVSRLPSKKLRKEKMKQPYKSPSLSRLPSSAKPRTSKIASLYNYVKNLYDPEDQSQTDRSGFSTISQLSMNSRRSTRPKTKYRKFFETVLAIVLALPVCVVLDLGKLLVSLFWLFLRTLLGMPEPEEAEQPVVAKQKKVKRRRLCRVKLVDDKMVFRLRRPRRCFLVGERLKVYRRICHAENMSFMHNMNKLMFDSNLKYDYESDSTSDVASVSSVITMRDGNMDRSFSNQYVDDSDVILESDLDTVDQDKLITDDELEELKTFSMNPFDLDDSDEEILNMMRKSYDSADPDAHPKKGKKKKGKIANYITGMYFKRMARKGKYIDEQHLSDYEQDSDENTTNDNKIGLIATLKKVKDQIIMANYKINLYNMRFEKFLNMFSWKNYSVTTIVLFLLMLVIFLNLLFSIEIIMLAYILLQFKSGYRRGTWERIILSTTRRHINKAIVELEIFRPFWDLSTHQIRVLANRIKAFSSIELEINTIREAKDELHLAYIVSDKLIATRFARNWKRYRWINNLFRQAPCKQY